MSDKKNKKKKSMTVFTPDKSELMEITSFEQQNGNLIVKGKIMGSMPMTAVIRPEEARRGLRLIDFKLARFLLTFLFRRGAAARSPK